LIEKLIDDMKEKMPKTNGKADKKSEEVKEK